MTTPGATELTVVIPTMGRWEILEQTLGGLEAQTATGFEVIVVSDGAGPPPRQLMGLGETHFVTQTAAGPAAARNRGVGESTRSLILFLGDDMVPAADLVSIHVTTHGQHPDPQVAVLGRVEWHPEVAGNRLNRWLEDSGTQFDYANMDQEKGVVGDEAYDPGFGRLYSSNLSLKRSLFDSVGGFDESFIFYYEDLELGWRLSEKGLRIVYRPEALARHLHAYDWVGLEDRFRGIALGEKLLGTMRPDFHPFFQQRIMAAGPPASSWGYRAERLIGPGSAWAAAHAPPSRPGLAAKLRDRADTAYHRCLAGPFLEAWSTADEMCELRDYLGTEFRPELLIHHKEELEREADAATDELSFYRTSQSYLYDLTAFAMSPTKQPYLAELSRLVSPGARILDYGCGIGSDGLRLANLGYQVSFADFDNPSTRFLRWRLERRGLSSRVYDIDTDDIPTDFDTVFCFDVIEHVPDPSAFLSRLESLGDVVIVNFLEPDPRDTHLHRDLDIGALVARAERHGLLYYRIHHGRSHLVAYRSSGSGSLWTSRAVRWRGQVLHGHSRVNRTARSAKFGSPRRRPVSS